MKKSQNNNEPLICTECGDELEEFCFSPLVHDLDAIKRRLETCKKNGRFQGECCARLFIAEDPPRPPPDPTDDF